MFYDMVQKHKVFVSYYHKDDQAKRNKFERLFKNIFISKSVNDGDIKSDLSSQYIKKLIASGYISDASVLVVLIGKNTWKRKHVDWEISAALNKKSGGYSGVVGILLPRKNYLKNKIEYPTKIPPRLEANRKTGYAKVYRWNENESIVKKMITEAFNTKDKLSHKIVNSSIPQFKINRK